MSDFNKSNARKYILAEFKGMVDYAPPGTLDEIFEGLDQDNSGYVNFQEFVTMVAALACATNEMLLKQ